MKLTENAKKVLDARYLLKDDTGEIIETYEGLFRRVADAIAKAESNYGATEDEVLKLSDMFYDMMVNLDFLPNSPTLMNAGKPGGQLAACFVLPIEDNMESIFEAIKRTALIHKSGGGTGFSFSKIRQNGSIVHSTMGVASGPVSFMKVFNAATEAVKQGGTRRGANMGILRVDHPDIMEFIHCKQNNAEITNFNISVALTNKFMNALSSKDKSYDLLDPTTKKLIGIKLNAEEVFNEIIEGAWNNGEPGIIFIDEINNFNPILNTEIESTNPCGEQPLLPNESCNLGSINLSNMVTYSEEFGTQFDWDKLTNTVKLAVRFLDDVIDINCYPIKDIEDTVKKYRKIGLGVMGYADALLKLGIPYGSKEAIAFGEKVMKCVRMNSYEASALLGKERGSFPEIRNSIYKTDSYMRNATTTTIAPTGTLSMIAGCSSGIEPVFAYAYTRKVMDTELTEIHPILKDELKRSKIYTEELAKKIYESGSIANVMKIPKHIKDVFLCAHDITPKAHIETQAAFQNYTENAVSKTVNFPNSATKEDVKKVFLLAYSLHCKGVTVYRDGSRDTQVLVLNDRKEEKKTPVEIEVRSPRNRQKVMRGFTEKVKIGCGNLYVTVNYDENGICEVFTNTGKAGGCPSQSEATARLASVILRSGVSLDILIDQLKGIRCPSTLRQKNIECTSCPDAIANVIKKVQDILITESNERPVVKIESSFNNINSNTDNLCPECKAPLEHEGGCVICRNCGYSRCI